jgi:hypothetical protein
LYSTSPPPHTPNELIHPRIGCYLVSVLLRLVWFGLVFPDSNFRGLSPLALVLARLLVRLSASPTGLSDKNNKITALLELFFIRRFFDSSSLLLFERRHQRVEETICNNFGNNQLMESQPGGRALVECHYSRRNTIHHLSTTFYSLGTAQHSSIHQKISLTICSRVVRGESPRRMIFCWFLFRRINNADLTHV